MKTFARKWLLPPGIYQLLADAPPSLKRVWSSKSESIELNPSGKKPATLDELRGAHYGEIVWVETEKIRLWGRALTPQQNQHVRYFENGVYSYRRFFELHQPQNQFEAIMLDATKVGGGFFPVRFPKDRKPWSFEHEFLGEGPLDASNGTQAHGPVSEKKLLWEKKRLDTIRDSVEKSCFRRFDGKDFIRFGELLLDDSQPGPPDYRVCLVGGAHRASLLAYLGWPTVPMMPEPTWPFREVCLSDLPRWPGVLDGTFSEEAARAYFLAHFRDPTEELLPGW